MPTDVSLVISLLFGIAQILAGGAVVWWLISRRLLGRRDRFVLLLIALWFIGSGCAELFVSGMEALRLVAGWPGQQVIGDWRGRADAALLTLTAALLLALPVYLVVRGGATHQE